MNTLVLLACVCFLVLPDVVWSKQSYDSHSKYHVGHFEKGSMISDDNRGQCVEMEYPPFTLFHDELVNDAAVFTDVGTFVTPHYLTTLVSGIPEQGHSEGGTTTISGSRNKFYNKFGICTHKKETGGLEGGDYYSRINWLTWNGDLAPNQMTENVFLEFAIMELQANGEACREVELRILEVSDTFVFSAGLCYSFGHTGNIAVWTRRIVGSENSSKRMEVCVALDELPIMRSVCVHGVGIKSELKEDVVEDAGLIQTDSIITDLTQVNGSIANKCTEVPFEQKYDIDPVVFVSPSYRTSCNDHDPGLIAWVEYSNGIGFKACVSRFEPHVDKIGGNAVYSMLLNYVVIPHDDTVLKKEEKPMRNAISIEFGNGKGINTIDDTYLGIRLSGFVSMVLDDAKMRHRIDSFYQTISNSIVLNLVVQHEGMGLTGTMLTQTANRFERMCRVLYLTYKNREKSEEELINVINNSTIKFDNDGERQRFIEIARQVLNLKPLEKKQGGYGTTFEDLIAITDADSLKVTAHQECIVGGFISGLCSAPTCVPGLYSGTKVIKREIRSKNTKETLCPKDLYCVVPCNQSPCELNGWKAPNFLEDDVSNVKSPAQVADKTTIGNPKIGVTNATGTAEKDVQEYMGANTTMVVLATLGGITVVCSCVIIFLIARRRKNMASQFSSLMFAA